MSSLSSDDGLLRGFANPVMDAQGVFRTVLAAMACPGTMNELALDLSGPAPLDPATAALALALLDYETPLWLDSAADTPSVQRYLRFHCGCRMTENAGAAAFAIVAAPALMPPLAAFDAGSDTYPDRSTTVILQVPSLTGGAPWTLQGPGIRPGGIRERACMAISGLPAGFGRWIEANVALFPCGVDLIFTCGRAFAALPRSIRVEDAACMSQ